MSFWIETDCFELINIDYIRSIYVNTNGKLNWLEALEEDKDAFRKHYVAYGTESQMIEIQERINRAMLDRGLLIFSAAPEEDKEEDKNDTTRPTPTDL